MAVDARVTSVRTELTARDPDLVNNPRLIAQIVARVMEEIARQHLEDRRRDADRQPSRRRGAE